MTAITARRGPTWLSGLADVLTFVMGGIAALFGLLSLLGGALGLLLGHGMIWACSPWIVEWSGVVVGLLQFQWMELVLIPGLIVLASAVGYLPALTAYRTDVARSLTNTP